jgi:hypothetical protein
MLPFDPLSFSRVLAYGMRGYISTVKVCQQHACQQLSDVNRTEYTIIIIWEILV